MGVVGGGTRCSKGTGVSLWLFEELQYLVSVDA